MFRAIISPILMNTRLSLQLVVQCTDDAAGWLPAGRWAKNCPKHIELIEIINKLLLLHLVGCLFYCISDARSH